MILDVFFPYKEKKTEKDADEPMEVDQKEEDEVKEMSTEDGDAEVKETAVKDKEKADEGEEKQISLTDV